jgi:2-phospho-L-lactate guanylyltransferase
VDPAGKTHADRAGKTQADPAGKTQADPAGKTRDPAGTRRVGRGFVPDAPGDGTVLLTAPAGVPLDPRFGAGSAAAHAASGATELAGDWPGLRQDVDTPADLRVVLELGAGAYTCGLLRDIGRTAGCGSVAPAR